MELKNSILLFVTDPAPCLVLHHLIYWQRVLRNREPQHKIQESCKKQQLSTHLLQKNRGKWQDVGSVHMSWHKLVKVLENCSSIYSPRPAENNSVKSHCCTSITFCEINCIILNTIRTRHRQFVPTAHCTAYNEHTTGNVCSFLLPGTRMSRRPLAYHINNYNIRQNAKPSLGIKCLPFDGNLWPWATS